MKVTKNPMISTGNLGIRPLQHQRKNSNATATTNSFHEILQEKVQDIQPIRFSKHAVMRLNARNIEFTPEQMEKIQTGVAKADEKGIKDSLMLIDNIALVVNVKNKVIVTAMDSQQTEENVFTNIDGAVLL